MSNIFIIGVTGGVGSRLAPKLIEAGHQVSGLYRKPEQEAPLREGGITPYFGDLKTLTTNKLAAYGWGRSVVSRGRLAMPGERGDSRQPAPAFG